MIVRLLAHSVIVAVVALGALVSGRAWEHRPARWFLAYTIGVALFGLGVALPDIATPPGDYRISLTAVVVGLTLIDVALLGMLAALFLPHWWEGRRPIRWVLMPYALCGGAAAADLLAGAGLAFGPISLEGDLALPEAIQPGNAILAALFYGSWLVHQAILWVTYARRREHRPLISAMALALAFAVVGGWFVGEVLRDPDLAVLIVIPMLLVLAYAVLRTRLFSPTDAAVGQALGAISDAVAIYNGAGTCVYANPRAQALGAAPGLPLGGDPLSHGALAAPDLALELRARQELRGQRLECERAPVRDRRGRLRGAVLLGRDVTEVERRTAELEQERGRLAATVRDLADERDRREALAATVRSLSLPAIPVLDGVIVLPLIGDLDERRAAELSGVLLGAIERERAHLALIDITGVPLLDTAGAAALLEATRAARLLGARCMLVGVRPEIAQTLVALGVSLDGLGTAASLREGLRDLARAGAQR